MLKRIYVNRHHIAHNKKAGRSEKPPFTVRTYRQLLRGFGVRVLGKSKLVYSPDNPLSCGATAWIETRDEVVVIDTENKEKILS